jgi:hypothetical protein
MKSLVRIGRSQRYVVFASMSFASFGLLFGGLRTLGPQSPNPIEIKVVNKTATLQIVSVDRTPNGHVHLLLKNVSSKNLNGYEVSVGAQGRITTDTSSGDRVISPGTTDELEVPVESAPSSLTILAAMFADGSIEGDEATVIELKQWRSGLKRQLIRALGVLETTLELPDVNTPEALDRLESQLSSLSTESSPAQPRAASGSRDAKDNLITNVQILRQRLQRQGAPRQRERLLELKERIERRIASLPLIISFGWEPEAHLIAEEARNEDQNMVNEIPIDCRHCHSFSGHNSSGGGS